MLFSDYWECWHLLQSDINTHPNWQTTGTLGAQIRYFKKHTCDAFATHELPNEAAARGRRAARKQPGVAGTNTPARPVAATLGSKSLNLITYKLHALGDYVRTIQFYGTTDSYSTQPVSHIFIIIHKATVNIYMRYRASSSIDESNASMREQTKIRL